MSDDEEEMTRTDDFVDYEGWFWIGVFHLVSFWMCEDNAAVEELSTIDKSWSDKRRPVHVGTSFPVEGGSTYEEHNAGTTIFCGKCLDWNCYMILKAALTLKVSAPLLQDNISRQQTHHSNLTCPITPLHATRSPPLRPTRAAQQLPQASAFPARSSAHTTPT